MFHLTPSLDRSSSIVIGLLATVLVIGCGEDSTSTGAVIDFPPQIAQLVFPSEVLPGVSFQVSHSLSVPGGLPATDMAVQISWSFPNGSTLVAQRFSAAQIGCLAGSISCTNRFMMEPPPELAVVNTTYEVVFAVFDRQGRRAEQVRTVSLIAP